MHSASPKLLLWLRLQALAGADEAIGVVQFIKKSYLHF